MSVFWFELCLNTQTACKQTNFSRFWRAFSFSRLRRRCHRHRKYHRFNRFGSYLLPLSRRFRRFSRHSHLRRARILKSGRRCIGLPESFSDLVHPYLPPDWIRVGLEISPWGENTSKTKYWAEITRKLSRFSIISFSVIENGYQNIISMSRLLKSLWIWFAPDRCIFVG